MYYETKCEEYKFNTKILWTVINEICRKNNDKTSTIEYLKIEKLHKYNADKISNHLGKYFSSVGKLFAEKIPIPNWDIKNYLNPIKRNPFSLMLTPVCEQEIAKIISKLPMKHSSGYDNISNVLLKRLSSFLSLILCKLCNMSLTIGVFLDTMKIAEVVPLYKGKNPYEECNYRPISLLTTMSKILEKGMYTMVYGFLNNTSQIYNSQYGFRAKHSCDHSVSEVISEILKNSEKNKYTIGLFLDLSKAFDTLDHPIVLKKMDLYGVPGMGLHWFESYLKNRALQVKCTTTTKGSETKSDLYSIEYGTPQGSCLSPLIFLIFVNDLDLHLEMMSYIQFVDDTTLLFSHASLKYLCYCVETDLTVVQDWFYANKLMLNIDKSSMMIFGKNNNSVDMKITIGGIVIPRVHATKFLGVWLDDKLSWSIHVTMVRKKLQSRQALLKRSKSFLSCHCMKILYFAQIQSILAYGIIVWGPMLKEYDLKMLQKIQNNCLKCIKPKQSLSYINRELRVLPVHKLIKLEQAKLGFRLCNNMLPTRLSEALLTDHMNMSIKKQHNYNTRRKQIPNLPSAHSTQYRNSFLCKVIST